MGGFHNRDMGDSAGSAAASRGMTVALVLAGILAGILYPRGAQLVANWNEDRGADSAHWSRRYAEVCLYDRHCRWVDRRREIRPAADEAIVIVKIFRKKILAAADLYRVDPRAIAGVIIGEHGLNSPMKHDIERFLVTSKLAPNGSLFGRPIGFGLGQVHTGAALQAEPLASRVERRATRNLPQIAEAIADSDRAVLYIAAILRCAQEDYARKGIDISGRPEILATLYNIGHAAEHAREATAEKRAPRVNYFGLFVERNLGIIQDALDGAPGRARRETSRSRASQYRPDAKGSSTARSNEYTDLFSPT